MEKLLWCQAYVRAYISRKKTNKLQDKKEKKSNVSNSFMSTDLNNAVYKNVYDFKTKVESIQNPNENPLRYNDGVRRNFPKYTFGLGTKTYAGEWLNGKRDGFGVLQFKDGSIFKGFFYNDLANGLGI